MRLRVTNWHNTPFSLLICLLFVCVTGRTGTNSYRLLGDFERGWQREWEEKRLTRASNRFDVVTEDGDSVLRVTSNESAAGMFRDHEIKPLVSARVSWRWKVDHSLTENKHEMEKKGDDYAARVFVVFKSSFFLPWTSRSICYVWAGNQSAGSIYKNPYSGGVQTMVLQSGDDNAEVWMSEERDIVADYELCFGERPAKLSGVAVMVDTDQTGARATAWFDDLVVETW
jgi:hypothetical protein